MAGDRHEYIMDILTGTGMFISSHSTMSYLLKSDAIDMLSVIYLLIKKRNMDRCMDRRWAAYGWYLPIV